MTDNLPINHKKKCTAYCATPPASLIPLAREFPNCGSKFFFPYGIAHSSSRRKILLLFKLCLNNIIEPSFPSSDGQLALLFPYNCHRACWAKEVSGPASFLPPVPVSSLTFSTRRSIRKEDVPVMEAVDNIKATHQTAY